VFESSNILDDDARRFGVYAIVLASLERDERIASIQGCVADIQTSSRALPDAGIKKHSRKGRSSIYRRGGEIVTKMIG
jgi:hypothetical protein